MNWIDRLFASKKRYQFIFPYSVDFHTRCRELLQNLENGILLEDLNVFIEWNIPFKNLSRHVKRRLNRKVFFDTGQHIILDGLLVHLDPHERMINFEPFITIYSFLGWDEGGHKRYLEVKHHLILRFGEPNEIVDTLPYDFFGDKSLQWRFDKFEISLNTWERFAVHYSLRINTAKNYS